MRLAREIQQQYQLGERDFTEENLTRQNLSFQTLDDSDFSHTDLSHTNLSHASFKSVNFQNADLSYSICTSANFTDANLSGAILTAANLSGAIFTNTIYNHHTQFPEGFDPELTDAIKQSQPAETDDKEPSTSIQLLDHSSETKDDPEHDTGLETDARAIDIDSSNIDIDQDDSSDILEEQTGQTFIPDLQAFVPTSPPPVSENPDTTIQAENKIPDQSLAEIPAREDSQSSDISPNSDLETTPTALVSPAPEKSPNSEKEKKKKIGLIILAAIAMPACGGLAYLIHSVYQTYQTQQSFLNEINEHRDAQNYQSCLQSISNAESEVSNALPILNFSEQLKVLKESCTNDLASENLNEGIRLKDNEQYEDAIALLSQIPSDTSSYQTAKDQIQIAGERFCQVLKADAKNATDQAQFIAILDRGQNFPTQNAIAQECQQQMLNLRDKWDENIPALTEAEKLLQAGDCQGVEAIANSLKKSIFLKWQKTSSTLSNDATGCKTPIDTSSTLPARSTHTLNAVAGQSLKIDLRSRAFDPVVTLLDANGNEIGKDDDTGAGRNALLTIKLQRSGEFQIKVSAYDKKNGSYTLKVTR